MWNGMDEIRRKSVDWDSIFAQVPEVMGLPGLRLKGSRWIGPYYLSGAESSRADKMVVMRGRRGDGMITVGEQGGEVRTLVSWLIEYRGVDRKDVYRFLEGREHCEPLSVAKVYGGPARTVERWRYIEAGGGGGKWCNPLFWTLAEIWGADRVAGVFRAYGVTDGLRSRRKDVVGTRFWYINRHGEILFDKTMFYRPDGHRDKDLHPMRQYKVDAGYTKTCFFGEHLIGDDNRPVMVVESEKSAIICALEFPDYHWVACGGLKCLLRLDKIEGRKVWLVPDMDGAEEWSRAGKVWRWWEKCGRVVGEKWDLADVVMYKYGK